MNYTKCWLAYPRIQTMGGAPLRVRCDFTGPVAGRIMEELRWQCARSMTRR